MTTRNDIGADSAATTLTLRTALRNLKAAVGSVVAARLAKSRRIRRSSRIARLARGRIRPGRLLHPIPFALGAELRRERVGLDELGRLLDQVEEGLEVFTVDEEPGLADLRGFVVALAFGEDEIVIAVVGFLHLGGVSAGANAFEEVLEENVVVGFFAGRRGGDGTGAARGFVER